MTLPEEVGRLSIRHVEVVTRRFQGSFPEVAIYGNAYFLLQGLNGQDCPLDAFINYLSTRF